MIEFNRGTYTADVYKDGILVAELQADDSGKWALTAMCTGEGFCADYLRQIADKLDELNKCQ